MKKTTYTCDRCGKEIEGVAYELTCYAEDVTPDPFGTVSTEMATQNMRQNMSPVIVGKCHLCRACKDAITDGVFIV